jgi:hypothetical protein
VSLDAAEALNPGVVVDPANDITESWILRSPVHEANKASVDVESEGLRCSEGLGHCNKYGRQTKRAAHHLGPRVGRFEALLVIVRDSLPSDSFDRLEGIPHRRDGLAERPEMRHGLCLRPLVEQTELMERQ